ncbi:hypothetical protein GCM10011490_10580 [Pseudoclavibacter endophyticus]|nr:hypothetical protein GCM10011490_10580 [Pseudoclavibacter endophyticus]
MFAFPLALTAAALALAGCSLDVSVPASDVESQAAAALEPQLGYAPEISCPDSLPAEVGHTMVCELTDDTGATHDATITVTEVDGTDVNFDVSVG